MKAIGKINTSKLEGYSKSTSGWDGVQERPAELYWGQEHPDHPDKQFKITQVIPAGVPTEVNDDGTLRLQSDGTVVGRWRYRWTK